MITELIDLGMTRFLDSTYNPSQWLIDWANGGEPTSAGEHINEESAMRIPAVRAAVNVQAETMQVLPVNIYRREKSGRKTLVDDHPVLTLLNRQPNRETTAPRWWYSSQRNASGFGNAFSIIQRTGRGDPYALWQRSSKPDRTKLVRNPKSGKLEFRCRDNSGQEEDPVALEDMLHIAYNSDNALAGQSPISQLKEAIGGNKAAERYANELFRNGTAVQGHYTVPGTLTEPAYDRLKKSMESYAEHGNRHKRPLLEEGTLFQQSTIDANSTQMIEARNFMIAEVARIWRINPYLLYVQAYGGKAGPELFREFMQLTMLPWCISWKGEIDVRLLKPPFECEFDLKKFMEGDPNAQAAWYRTMFSIGYYSLNEIRREQGENEITDSDGKADPNADEHFIPRNMVPLSKATDKDWVLGKSGGDGVTESPGAVAPGDGVTPGEPGEPQAHGPGSLSSNEAVAAAEAVVADTLKRMERIEANEAIRAAKDPRTFLTRLDAFYVKHAETLREALERPVRTVVLLRDGPSSGGAATDVEIDETINEHVGGKREALLAASECPAAKLPERVAAVVEAWGK